MRILTISVIVFFCYVINACRKEDPITKSRTELLTQKPWKFHDAGFDGDRNGTVDQQDPYIEDCDKDNLATFHADGTGIGDEGTTKCDPASPQTAPFTWSFSNGEKNITIKGQTFTIQELNDTYLKAYFDTVVSGMSFRYLTISKH